MTAEFVLLQSYKVSLLFSNCFWFGLVVATQDDEEDGPGENHGVLLEEAGCCTAGQQRKRP